MTEFQNNAYPEPHTADCPRFHTSFPWRCDCQERARRGLPPPRMSVPARYPAPRP